jgi:hypothetical protein
MANVDFAFGFKPVKHYLGGIVRANEYEIAGGYTSNIFQGDPVKSTGTTKRIELAVVSTNALGVFDGCRYVNPQGEVIYSPYWPASTVVQTGSVVTAFVFDDPLILFEIQEDGLGGAAGVAAIGAMADFIAGTGSTLTGRSAYELDSSSVGQASMKIVDYVRDDTNDPTLVNARFLVLWNEHEHNTSTMTGV